MIELIKWTLGFVTLMMAYILMVVATANAAETTYAEIIDQTEYRDANNRINEIHSVATRSHNQLLYYPTISCFSRISCCYNH